ncbi:hypothetical protein CN645_30795 [Burkholderia sp. IDO3]|nr:hypothetical protein DCN14_32280 [Burkholderia sp. IDO3]PCD58091.1 hypothetical protein CN645_30795 [Burkholderia sp. IDO3]
MCVLGVAMPNGVRTLPNAVAFDRGFPMASAILKFIRPAIFPIMDVRAYRALTGIQPSYATYSYEKYISYAQKVTNIARQLNRPLREIDEQLYCYDKLHNGKI